MLGADQAIVGMVHLDPLPGAPGGQSIEDVLTAAKRDIRRLESGGVDALMIENFGDAPFYPDSAPKHVIAAMTRIVTELQSMTTLPLGVNVLRNDACGAVSIAAATDIDFIRINVHVGARVTDQGIVEGTAHDTLRLREKLGTSVRLFADVDVKHSAPLADFSVADQVENTIERGLADGIIISGASTGKSVDGETLENVNAAIRGLDSEAQLIVGSGVSPKNISETFDYADAAIVGSALKRNGDPTEPVLAERVERLVEQR